MLLEEFPTSIQVSGGEYLQNKIADVTLTTFEFESGVKGHIFISWLHPFKEQKLIVVGSRKMAVFDDVSKEKLLLYPHVVEWKKRVPVANKAQPEVVPFEMEEPLKAECSHFLECILENRVPRTDGQEGLQVLEVLQSCQKSLDNGGQKISFGRSSESGTKIHPTSEIDDGCEIGEGTVIWSSCHIMRGSKIGKNCRIGQNVVIGPEVEIGNGCKIQDNSGIFKGVTFDDYVFCGPSVVFTNVINPRSEVSRSHEFRKTFVRKGATIGANATIVCGNVIHHYAFVGAGAVVTKDVPAYTLVVGNPARIVGWVCSCGVKLEFDGMDATCRECGKKFRKNEDFVQEIT
jgi:UDP-2-acetamido-3-amino-2,3-dideoxy-glucuronate N-acetyltransferase